MQYAAPEYIFRVKFFDMAIRMSTAITRSIASAGYTGLFLLLMVTGNLHGYATEWLPLVKDGLHDPENAGIKWLQNPAEALSRLPADSAGKAKPQ